MKTYLLLETCNESILKPKSKSLQEIFHRVNFIFFNRYNRQPGSIVQTGIVRLSGRYAEKHLKTTFEDTPHKLDSI